MKKRIGSLLMAFVFCVSLLPQAAFAAESTTPCEDGSHKWEYGNPDCATCGAPLRAHLISAT